MAIGNTDTLRCWLAVVCLLGGLAACGDESSGGGPTDTGDAGDVADGGGDAETDPDVAPDRADDPSAEPDVAPDAGFDADADAEVDAPGAPEFQLVYEPDDEAPVGVTDIMGAHLTEDRLYVTGLWQETARVSYFVRDDLATPAPWCLNDQLGWPTAVADDPTDGSILVADMVNGLFVIAPPDEAGDCGCDDAVESECAFDVYSPPGITGLGGLTVDDAGVIYVSGIDLDAQERAVWLVTIDDGATFDQQIAGGVVGDTIGIQVSAAGDFLYLANSDGALTVHTVDEEGVAAGGFPLQSGPPGFPTDVAADASYYYWPQMSPFAHPETGVGGSVLRVTLDGTSVDEIGAGSLVWPAGVTSDGDQWYIVDRATGIWGFF